MKKSVLVSFCGWCGFALGLFIVTATLLAGALVRPPIPAAAAGYAMLVAIPFLGVWILGTVVHRFRVGGARIQARAMVEAQQQMVVQACSMCASRPAVVRCRSHALVLCPTCWTPHNRDGCSYEQVVAVAAAPGIPLRSPRVVAK